MIKPINIVSNNSSINFLILTNIYTMLPPTPFEDPFVKEDF